MRRRQIIATTAAAILSPLPGAAQQATHPLRVGLVSAQPRVAPNLAALEQRLAELGYQEGRNLFIDYVNAATADAWVAGYREIEARNVDIMVASGPEISINSPYLFRDRVRLADFALRKRLRSNLGLREFVQAGGLMSYGPSITGMYRRAAEYIDRIARGSRPGDLPIEQPTKFELVLNARTAKALDITIPSAILARADEVIE